ncbi:MAG: hypothetical protein K2Y28_06015 [Burkholderiaceae bacterium]|nr:hypothetical protein [Burkholderiaceae bacterium]
MAKSKVAKVVQEDDDGKPNTFGWLQLEKKSASELKRLAIKSPIAMGSLMYMVERMSRSNSLMVGQEAIANDLGVTARSVSSAIILLEKLQFIEVTKVGTGYVYTINTRVFWQGVRGARFAHFNADVYAVESEQKTAIDGREKLKSVPKLMDGERLLVTDDDIPPPDQKELLLP